MALAQDRGCARLNLSELQSALNSRRKLCVLGYGLSDELDLPHFDDVLSGVWSGVPKNIDPFVDSRAKKAVLNWFAWRMRLIAKVRPSRMAAVCAELQRVLDLSMIATQTVDAYWRLGGMRDVQELYGDVFDGRCLRCGDNTSFPTWQEAVSAWELPCMVCGGAVLPDVAMFGWNRKELLLDRFLAAVKEAEVIILVGVSEVLAPFRNGRLPGDFRGRILEILPEAFVLSDRSILKRARREDLFGEFEKARGRLLEMRGAVGLGAGLEDLLQLSKALKCF